MDIFDIHIIRDQISLCNVINLIFVCICSKQINNFRSTLGRKNSLKFLLNSRKLFITQSVLTHNEPTGAHPGGAVHPRRGQQVEQEGATRRGDRLTQFHRAQLRLYLRYVANFVTASVPHQQVFGELFVFGELINSFMLSEREAYVKHFSHTLTLNSDACILMMVFF